MQTYQTTETAAFAANLKTISDLLPAMPESRRRSAAWAVARGQANLADAVKAEGYSLTDTTHASPAVRVDPTKNPNHKPGAPTASQAAELAQIRRDIHALRDGPPAPAVAPLPGESGCIDIAGYPPSESKAIHVAAVAMTKRDSTVTYRRAVEILTARTA